MCQTADGERAVAESATLKFAVINERRAQDTLLKAAVRKNAGTEVTARKVTRDEFRRFDSYTIQI